MKMLSMTFSQWYIRVQILQTSPGVWNAIESVMCSLPQLVKSGNEWLFMHRASLHLWILGNLMNFRIWFGFITLPWAFISYHCGIQSLPFGDQTLPGNFLFSCRSYHAFHRFLQSILCMAIDNLLIAQHGGQIILIVTGWSSQRSHSARASEVILVLICFENQRSQHFWIS